MFKINTLSVSAVNIYLSYIKYISCVEASARLDFGRTRRTCPTGRKRVNFASQLLKTDTDLGMHSVGDKRDQICNSHSTLFHIEKKNGIMCTFCYFMILSLPILVSKSAIDKHRFIYYFSLVSYIWFSVLY